MLIPKIGCFKYTIDELKADECLNRESVLELRTRMSILVIDDEEFTPKDYLLSNNFRIVCKKDIDNITDVSEYDIIMCDIKGVGHKLSEKYEGAYLISEIRKCYPGKRIIAYTASRYDVSYNDFFRQADIVLQKGISIKEWVDVLDNQIEYLVNPIFQWEITSNRLKESKVPTHEIALLESDFVAACKSGKFDRFTKKTNKLASEAKNILQDLITSMAVKVLKGGIG